MSWILLLTCGIVSRRKPNTQQKRRPQPAQSRTPTNNLALGLVSPSTASVSGMQPPCLKSDTGAFTAPSPNPPGEQLSKGKAVVPVFLDSQVSARQSSESIPSPLTSEDRKGTLSETSPPLDIPLRLVDPTTREIIWRESPKGTVEASKTVIQPENPPALLLPKSDPVAPSSSISENPKKLTTSSDKTVNPKKPETLKATSTPQPQSKSNPNLYSQSQLPTSGISSFSYTVDSTWRDSNTRNAYTSKKERLPKPKTLRRR